MNNLKDLFLLESEKQKSDRVHDEFDDTDSKHHPSINVSRRKMGIGEDNRKSKMKTLSRKERKTKNQHDFQHDFLFFMMITKMDVIMMITMFRTRIKHSQLIFV